VACGPPEGDRDGPARSEAEAEAVPPGELVEVVRADGTATPGVAVLVAEPDGSTRPAYFMGPRPLAELASEGTWTFPGDSLHSRVRFIEPGETLRRREG
jgi:hypothetical protein